MNFVKKNLSLALTFVISLGLIGTAWISWPFRFGISDAVAQFFPAAYLGIKSYSHFDLPLYNWHQLLGIPLMGTGYYPVADPIFIISSVFSSCILGDPQFTWDITCSSYMVAAALATNIYFSQTLRFNWVLSIVASISWAFGGMAIYEGGEWMYVLSAYFYIPLILILFDKWLTSRAILDSILISASVILFVLSSNIQIVFYAAHFVILLILIAPNALRRLRCVKALQYTGLTLMVAGICVGYVYLLFMTVGESTRELGPVSLDKYYWLQYDWRTAIKYAYFPYPCAWSFARTGGLYFQGLWVVAGMLLFPAALILLNIKEKAKVLLLLTGTVVALLLSMGSDGWIGGFLYQYKPYNMFRHSIKWAPFYQMMSVVLSFYTIDRLVKLKSEINTKWIYVAMLFVQVPMYVYYITTYDNAHSQRLTEVSLPINFDGKSFDNQYRIASLWVNGEVYKTQYPAPLLGYNFASYFGLFQISGYEPMIPKKNFDHVRGNWHPGYYTNTGPVDLGQFAKYSLRWILIPQYQFEDVKKTLEKSYPTIQLKTGPVLSMSPAVQILEIEKPVQLVSTNTAHVNSFYVQGNSVIADINEIKDGSRVLFSWVGNANFHVYVNGTETKWDEDEFGRVSVLLPTTSNAKVELRYFPKTAFYVFILGVMIYIFGILHLLVAKEFRR